MGTLGTIKRKCIEDPLPLLLILLALLVYLPGSTWGIPHPTGPDFIRGWGNDDLVPLHPLAEMHNTFVVAKPDRNIAYPWFHYFLLACAEAPYLLWLLFTGELTNPSPIFPYGFSDPVTAFRYLSWIGRSITMLLGLATVVGSYYSGKHLFGRKVGFLAAIFTMLMFPMAYYARLGNLDVPVMGWTSLGLAVFTLCLKQGLTVSRGLWLGAFVALAAATKGLSQAAGSFLFVPGILLWLHFRNGNPDRFWRWTSVWAAPVALTVSFLVVYVLASGIPIDPRRYVQHTAKLFLASTQIIYLRYPATLAGFAAQARDLFGYLIDVMSWPVLIAAGVGVLVVFRRDRRALFLALSSVSFFLLLLIVRFGRVHYLLAVALPLNVFAAYAFVRMVEASRRLRPLGLLLVFLVVGYMVLINVDLTHDMISDSRYAASSWLAQRNQPGDSLLFFGAGDTVPPLRTDVTTLKVSHRREAFPTIVEKRPDYILVMPWDFNEDRHRVEWRYGPHSIYSDYVPADVFAKLSDGSLGYRLVAQFQSPRLFPWLNRPFLSYATVNPPIHIFARTDRAQGAPKLEAWDTAPYNPRFSRVRELTVDNPLRTH